MGTAEEGTIVTVGEVSTVAETGLEVVAAGTAVVLVNLVAFAASEAVLVDLLAHHLVAFAVAA